MVRRFLDISFVAKLGCTGDCSICLEIDRLLKMSDR